METNTSPTPLQTLYNLVDWIDFILVFAIIAYIAAISPISFGYESLADLSARYIWDMVINNLTFTSLVLCLVSLGVSVAAITLAVAIFLKGENRDPFRLIGRFCVWGVWIPMDIVLIYWALQGLAG